MTGQRRREIREREESTQNEVPNMAVDIPGTEVSSHNIHYILLDLILRLLPIINEPLHNQARFTHTGHLDGGGWHAHLSIIGWIINRLQGKKGNVH